MAWLSLMILMSYHILCRIVINEPCHNKTGLRSDTNWAVQPQKMVRGLKFRI